MTDTQTDTEAPTKLVDLSILSRVHEAASARLTQVRDRERQLYGAARTDLTDVARATLRKWKPDPHTEPTRRRSTLVQVEQENDVWIARCSECTRTWPGSTPTVARRASAGHGKEHVSTFRFSIDESVYGRVKERIRTNGYSVASVIQEGLQAFADSGKL